jgi:F-type H+-transporting ATPase subunit b
MFSLLKRLAVIMVLSIALHSSGQVFANAEEHHAEAAGHETGLPMSWTSDLALFSLVTFVVYVVVLRFGAWGPLQAGLNERERNIRQNIADAESNRLKSEAMLKDYEVKLGKVQEEVRDILAEARRDADHTKQEIMATAQREADATKHRAIAEIERSRDLALTELFDFVTNNVINATEKVIGRSLSGPDQDRLVNDALSELNVRRN